jgi:hypothetical protein
MGFGEGGQVVKKFVYDPLVGRFTREIKSSRIFTDTGVVAAGNAATPITSGSSVAANRELFITTMQFSASDSDRIFEVTIDTSTIAQVLVTPDREVVIGSDINTPLARASGTAVVRIEAAASAGSGTITAFISGIVHPDASKGVLETK